MKSIDCRSLACPAPVLTTKETIEKETLYELAVLVDNEAAKQNVSRFLESQNFEVTVEEDGTDFRVIGMMGDELWRLVFVNNGVKLTTGNSEVLPILRELENEGIHILVCGTCLTHFHLLDKKQVGETTNMLDIVTAIQLADKVINI